MQGVDCQGSDNAQRCPGYWSQLSSEMWTTQESGTD